MFIKGFYIFNLDTNKDEIFECWINKDHIITVSNSDIYEDAYFLKIKDNERGNRSYYIKKEDMDTILRTDEDQLEFLKVTWKGGEK